MSNHLQIKQIQEVYPIDKDFPDDFFITCGSFEDRFLGVPQRLTGCLPKRFILFRYEKPKERIEELINHMEDNLEIKNLKENYIKILAEYGKSINSVLKLHNVITKNKINSAPLKITVDISTFTKDLLLNLMFYLFNFLEIKKLRLLYTVPGRYASPQEGWLSYGIKKIHIPPICWNEWSPLKDNLLIIILGFEEIRAWSLIDAFSADLNWLFITNPGSKKAWNNHCQEYNKRLLKQIYTKDKLPALNPLETSKILSKHITKNLTEKYNIFICPLGTKPQLIGTLFFTLSNSDIPINIITTTVANYNFPYYSWDVGDTFEFYFPINGEKVNE